MNYETLDDEEFFNQLSILNDNKSIEVFELLRTTPYVVERINKMIDEKKIKGSNLTKMRCFLNYSDSYNVIVKVKEIISNSNMMTGEERKTFFKKFFSNEDYYFRALKLFPHEEQKIIYDFCLSYHRLHLMDFNKYDILKKDYDKVIELIKKIISVYYKYDGSDDFYVYLADELNIDLKKCEQYVTFVEALYFRLLCDGNNNFDNEIINKFTFDEIQLIKKIKERYSFILNRSRYGFNNCDNNFEELFQLFDVMNAFLSNDSGIENFIDYMISNLKITLDEFENKYKSVFKKYCDIQISNRYTTLFKRSFKFSEIYYFDRLFVLYRQMVYRTNAVVEIICSDDENRDRIIEIIFNAKFFNGVKPSVVKSNLSAKAWFLEEKDKEKVSKFIADYYKYYFGRRKLEQEETEKEKAQEELDNIDLYVSYISDYLNSNSESLSDYFSVSGVDKKQFDKALEIVRSHEHPVFEEYSNHSEMLRKRNFAILMSKARKIISGIKNDIQLSNGELRKYDLVDFYSYTKMTPAEFLQFIKGNVSKGDYAIVARFTARYKNDRLLSGNAITKLYENEVSYVIKKDEDGNILESYEVTKEEKQQVIILLKDKGVPLTNSTYSIMLRRYVMENILKNDNDVKQKRKNI